VKTPESMSLDVMRRLAIALHDARVARAELTVCPDANFYLQNKKRAQIVRLEDESGKRVVIRGDAPSRWTRQNLICSTRANRVFIWKNWEWRPP